MPKRNVACLLALLIVAPAMRCRAAEPAVADVREILAPIREKHDVPALAAAVVSGWRVTALGVTGVRRSGDETPVTADDLFHLGSCAKAMTATVCGKLVDERVLAWDLTIAEAFPDVKPIGAAYRDVTLTQLLTNRGGIVGDLSSHPATWAALRAHDGSRTDGRRLLLQEMVKLEPAGPIGSFAYSNAGFIIAAHMAETKLGRPWEDLLRKDLFTPLGISSAGYGAPGITTEPGPPVQPWGHQVDGRPVTPGPGADNPPLMTPAGTVHMTIADWGRFAALHLQGAQGKCKLLTPDTMRRLHTPAPGEGQPYAMGWIITEREWAGGRTLTHAGSNTMWYAVVWIAPNKDFAVLAACNQGGDAGARACDDASAALLTWWLETQDASD